MSALAVVIRPTDHGPEDLDLVAGVRAGDDRAFELLFVRYQPSIAAYVRGMVNDRGRAEDITQEIFISALRRMRETEREIAFKPWIHEIARNACIDAFRRSRTRDEVSFDAQDALGAGFGRLAEPGATPDSVVEGKVAFDNLCGAIGGLSQTHHEILVMREFEGLSYDEIGERLGLSRAAVESALSRARRRLSQEYEELVSGERCLRVQRIVDAGGASAVSLRDRRRVARHLAHCQPCRRHAGLARVDVDAVARRPAAAAKAARIAAFLPLPMFVRRRFGADEATQLLGQQAVAPVVHWSASVAGGVDPTLIAGWTKAVATAAAVAVAGVGAGAAMTERAPLEGFVKRVPAIVSQSGPAVSGTFDAGSSGVGALGRASATSGGASFGIKARRTVAGRARGLRGRPQAVLHGPAFAGGATNESIRTAEPAGSGLFPPGPATAPTVSGREAPLKKSINNIVEKLDLTLTRASPLTGGTASGARGRRSQLTKGRAQRAIRKLIDKLRQVGGGPHADAGGAPTASAEAAPQGPTGVSPASPADTDAAAGAPAATPGILDPPIPTVVADTVSDLSGALTTTLSPAQQPS